MSRRKGWNRESSGKGWSNYMRRHAQFAASQDYAKGSVPDSVMAALDAAIAAMKQRAA